MGGGIYLVGEGGGLSFSSVGNRYHARNFIKPHPLISEKLAFGCTLLSNVESDTGMIQKTIIVHLQPVAKMASTGTYLSTIIIQTLRKLKNN